MKEQVKRKKSLLRAVLLAVVVVALTVGMFGCSKEPTLVSGNDAANADDKAENNVFKEGDTVELNDTVIYFMGVTQSNGSEYNKPEEGNVYILCEFEITNNSDEEITVSSILSFEAYCDDYSCSSSFGALMEKGDKGQLDGTVAAGKKLKGVIGYEVPEEWKELEIHYTPDLVSGKEVVFKAANN